MRPFDLQVCTTKCERVVTCTMCHRRKPPTGRDVASAQAGSFCEHKCPGHNEEPSPGHLWPGELASYDSEED